MSLPSFPLKFTYKNVNNGSSGLFYEKITSVGFFYAEAVEASFHDAFKLMAPELEVVNAGW